LHTYKYLRLSGTTERPKNIGDNLDKVVHIETICNSV